MNHLSVLNEISSYILKNSPYVGLDFCINALEEHFGKNLYVEIVEEYLYVELFNKDGE